LSKGKVNTGEELVWSLKDNYYFDRTLKGKGRKRPILVKKKGGFQGERRKLFEFLTCENKTRKEQTESGALKRLI